MDFTPKFVGSISFGNLYWEKTFFDEEQLRAIAPSLSYSQGQFIHVPVDANKEKSKFRMYNCT